MKRVSDEIIAYKVFYNGLINRYGDKFELKKEYRVEGLIQWGNRGNGFHMCMYPEDCFRYFNGEDDIVLTEVRGFGHMYSVDDEYYGYYDMYVCEGMEILYVYSREELINMMLNSYEWSVKRFLITCSLSPMEIEMFKAVYKDNKEILHCIDYYQESNKDNFVKRRGKING